MSVGAGGCGDDSPLCGDGYALVKRCRTYPDWDLRLGAFASKKYGLQ